MRRGRRRFLCDLAFGARVNDWFFSHAGNTGGRSLARLASDLQTGVDKDGFGSPELIGSNSILEARLGPRGPNGKSWFEAGGSALPPERLLDRYAAALGVRHIVEGHFHDRYQFPDGAERKAGEMFQWHGKLFLIDTGMSRGIGDSGGAVLRITPSPNETATGICGDGASSVLWDGGRESGKVKACPVTKVRGAGGLAAGGDRRRCRVQR